MTNQLMIVVKDTIVTHLKSKSYWILVLSPLISIFVIGIITFGVTKLQNNNTPKMAVISADSNRRETFIILSKSVDVKISHTTSAKEAAKALEKSKLDAVLTLYSTHATLATQPKSETIPKQQIKMILDDIHRANTANHFGLNEYQVSEILKPFVLKSVVKQNNDYTKSSNISMANYVVGACIAIVTLLVVMWYTSMIANEISNEKSSRIMEMLLAVTSPKIQYFGKLLGIFILAFIHMSIYFFTGVVGILLTNKSEIVKEITKNITGLTIPFTIYSITFLLTAVFLYMVLTALLASLINDNAQVQQAIQPITLIAIISYIFSFFMTFIPNNIVVVVLSYVPFFSQSMMPIRLVTHVTSWTNAYISLFISIGTLIILLFTGQRTYSKNVLSYSDAPLMNQVIKKISNK